MPFAAALSTNADTQKAIDEVCTTAQAALSGPVDLGLLFFSRTHAAELERYASTLRQRLGVSCLLGCTGESIVGNDQEIEGRPALSLWLARWPAPVTTAPFHMTVDQTKDGINFRGLPDSIGAANPQKSLMLLLGDPHSFPADLLLQSLNHQFPRLRVVGAMASGGHKPRDCKFLFGDTLRDHGAVGVLLSGPVAARCVVSQGWKPIGRQLTVTSASGNAILAFDGRSPLAQLQQLAQELTPHDQQLFQRGLHLGRLVEGPGAGNFHVWRSTFDRGKDVVVLDERIVVGQTVQCLVRDGATADEELRLLLQEEMRASEKKPEAALLFTCNHRGTRLFSKPHHDAAAVRDAVGNIPVAGFLANGEIGPVGGQNRMHGYTATITLFGDV